MNGSEPDNPIQVELDVAAEIVAAGEAELIDVRTEHEWRAGRIPGSRHVPLTDLSSEADRLGKDQELLIICRGGTRSAFAAEGLRSAGFEARAVNGGLLEWAEAGRELEPADGYVAESGEAAAVLEARERSGQRPPGINWQKN